MSYALLAIASFLGLGFVFSSLEKKFYLHPQQIRRSQWQLDTVYYFTGYFVGRFGAWICASIVTLFSLELAPEISSKAIAQQPFLLQFVAVLLVAELGYYCAHRLLHTVPFLWKFHAIHHSAKTMDWLTTTRVHPVDQLFTKIFQFVPVLCLGFAPNVLAAFFVWSAAIAFFIHANIRLKFPILRRIIVTPEIHHWHHSNTPATYHKNFAAQIALIDSLFGTFYAPKMMSPEKYGIQKSLPRHYFQQFIYPFK